MVTDLSFGHTPNAPRSYTQMPFVYPYGSSEFNSKPLRKPGKVK
jgi:hypothetical protein